MDRGTLTLVRARVPVALVVGAAAGTLVRNLPVAAAMAVSGGGPGRSCGMEAAVDCAFANLPDALAAVVRFGLLTLLFAGGAALAGAICCVLGVRMLRRAATADVRGAVLLAGGVGMVMPAAWLAVALVTAAH